MKFSELLGEPEPESVAPPPEGEPIGVFAPVPVSAPPERPPMTAPPAPPLPMGGRSGLAELNVRQEVPEAPATESSVQDQLVGLEQVVDDLLPSSRHRNRK